MNIKKMLIGGLAGSIFVTGVMAKNLVEKSSMCGSNIIKSGDKIDRKSTCRISAEYVRAGKLVIKQIKNPCFFIDKEQWEMWKGKKINNNTIVFTSPKGKNNMFNSFGAETRPDLGHSLKFHKGGKITNTVDGYEVLQILGKSGNCYKHKTVEEWIFHNRDYGKNSVVGKAKFYLR